MANARTAEQKTAKAAAIASAALSLQRELRFEEWTVSQVARRAGVAKGTVFLYYESKEALALAVLERLLGEWLESVDARLAESEPLTPASAAQAIARTLDGSGPLRRTLAMVGQLEHGAGRAAVERYRTWLAGRLDQTARRLEAGLPFLRPGEGVRLLLLVQALLIGYHALAEPTPAVDAALSREDLAPLRLDVRRALAESLWMQLEGLRAARGS